MQLVVEISEDTFFDLKKKQNRTEVDNAVINGTPLPKGHGRLIDADAFIKKLQNVSEKQKYKELLIDNHLTVDDVFKAVIESLQNEGLANGDAPTIIGTEME